LIDGTNRWPAGMEPEATHTGPGPYTSPIQLPNRREFCGTRGEGPARLAGRGRRPTSLPDARRRRQWGRLTRENEILAIVPSQQHPPVSAPTGGEEDRKGIVTSDGDSRGWRRRRSPLNRVMTVPSKPRVKLCPCGSKVTGPAMPGLRSASREADKAKVPLLLDSEVPRLCERLPADSGDVTGALLDRMRDGDLDSMERGGFRRQAGTVPFGKVRPGSAPCSLRRGRGIGIFLKGKQREGGLTPGSTSDRGLKQQRGRQRPRRREAARGARRDQFRPIRAVRRGDITPHLLPCISTHL